MGSMVNISNQTIHLEIATTPGAPPKTYEIEPGKQVELEKGYCHSISGSGREVLPPIASRLTQRDWPRKDKPPVRHPALVPVDQAKAAIRLLRNLDAYPADGPFAAKKSAANKATTSPAQKSTAQKSTASKAATKAEQA